MVYRIRYFALLMSYDNILCWGKILRNCHFSMKTSKKLYNLLLKSNWLNCIFWLWFLPLATLCRLVCKFLYPPTSAPAARWDWVYEMRSHFITKMEMKNNSVTQRLDKGMWVALLGHARIFVHSLDYIIVFFISFVIKFPFTLGHKHSPCCQLYEKEEQIAYSINMFIHLYIHD